MGLFFIFFEETYWFQAGLFTVPEDYWLHSSPSSFNEDLRRKKSRRSKKEDRCKRKRGEDGEEKVGKKARLGSDGQWSHWEHLENNKGNYHWKYKEKLFYYFVKSVRSPHTHRELNSPFLTLEKGAFHYIYRQQNNMVHLVCSVQKQICKNDNMWFRSSFISICSAPSSACYSSGFQVSVSTCFRFCSVWGHAPNLATSLWSTPCTVAAPEWCLPRNSFYT